MMAYQRDLVLAILCDGSPVREIAGCVTIPFHSEYKIRLKNKHSSLRAKARVWIDGRKVSGLGDFILKPGQTLDLERFLESSLDSGNRFKFVPLSDSRVNDPTDSANGLIKVEFYREQQFKIDPIPMFPIKPYTPIKGGTDESNRWTYDTYYTNNTGGVRSSLGKNSITSSVCDSAPANVNYVSNSIAGATVEGGYSGQQFSYGEHFSVETCPITLTLKLKAPKDLRHIPDKIIFNGPVEFEGSVMFKGKAHHCTNCGKRRKRRSDKFCANCGTKIIKRTA